MIELRGIQKYYVSGKKIDRGALFYALRGINAVFKKGEVTAIFGNSGSGKTTIGNIVTGFEKQDEGYVYYDGSLERDSHFIRYVFQDPYISLNATKDVEWHVETTAKFNGLDPYKIWEKLNVAGLRKEIYRLRTVEGLSGGERQRLAFSIAVSQDPEYIVLDEPFSYLDSLNLFYMLQMIRDMSKAISFIYLDHDLNRCSFVSDYMYVLKGGEVIEEGKPEQIIKDPHTEFMRDTVKNMPDIKKRI